MADFGQFPNPITWADKRKAYNEAKEFYGDAPRTIVVEQCGNVARLDMDGCGYRCTACFSVIGSIACGCTRQENLNA